MRFKFIRKAVSLMLTLATVSAAVFALPHSAGVSALTASEIRDQIAQYEKQQDELDDKIDSLESDKAEYKELQSALDDKIASIQEQIDLYNSRILSIQSKIDENKEIISEKEENINQTKDQLKQRLRAIYIAGSYSELAVLLSAEDYSDFLARSELIRGVTEHDTNLMNSLNEDIKEINRLNEENEQSMQENQELKADLVSKQAELDAEYKAAQSKLDGLSSDQSDLESDKAELQEEIEAKEAQLREIEAAIKSAQASSDRVYSGDGFAWPFQSSYYISCSYGQQSYRFHTGVDITCSGAYGKPIYAAADGTVIRATYSSTGYGNCITIDHGSLNGDHYATLYAHCSSLLVSSGQSVSKGQLIGYVGSTGNSTGPHLHFEVRVNGSSTNPMNYSYSTGF